MSLQLLLTLALAGSSLAAGVLGFGGGVVMFPLLFTFHRYLEWGNWMPRRSLP